MKTARPGLHAFTIALVVAATAHVGSTARAVDGCDRDCLRGFITRYLDVMVAHTPGVLPVSPTVRFTEDTVDMKLGEGLWKQASRAAQVQRIARNRVDAPCDQRRSVRLQWIDRRFGARPALD